MKIYEIFTGVSGEVGEFRQGSWCSFVRLAGCNLRCKWCDTKRAQDQDSGKDISIDSIFAELEKLGNNQVLITGGEPLLQQIEIEELIKASPNQYHFQIETNGSVSPTGSILRDSVCVFDFKLPLSGMTKEMLYLGFFKELRWPHWVKFVIADETDYQEAVRISKMLLTNIAFSACPPGMIHNELFQRMKKDGLKHVLNCQIHKLASLKEGG